MNQHFEVREAFRKQAVPCEALGSPFTARLCNLLAERLSSESKVGERVLNWPGISSGQNDALALRVCGALHALVVDGRSSALTKVYPPNHHNLSDDIFWQAIDEAFGEHAEFILQRIKSAPQTNEVRRASILLPGFSEITRQTGLPLVLSELGASAGLNLNWDKFHYEIGGQIWGLKDSKVQLSPEWWGARVELQSIEVVSRAGCDLYPLDVLDEAKQRRLLSYIWPDQSERIVRTKAAIDIAVAAGTTIANTDAIDWLEMRLNSHREGAAHVLYHTIAWQYFPEDVQRRGVELMRQAGKMATKDAPIAWLRFEMDDKSPGAALTLTLWPTGEEIYLARADFHGRWIDWQ